ncbi:hypothetical protein HU200_002283 [Digitaria exilis]|uniref:Protein GAMETE EXPRESSED 1 n=1 Tax=Digitaria exilis TaxID=1010633 RepID=A0A835KWV1_9POAL|nr:hypothetical protein HU200_002283 [Digitaria exilis]
MKNCCKRLSESEGKVYLEFFLETNTLCHQLQAEAFKQNTEKLVNDLTKTSKSAEEKLGVIEETSEQIIKESGKVKDTLSSIEMQAGHLAETSKNMGEQITYVLAHSKAIIEQSKEIATFQAALKEGQTEMREKIDAGMARLKESYERLGSGMDKLTQEAGYIQREIKIVGDSISSKMQDLQSTANDIESAAGKSLENQMQLLADQSRAMEGLNNLHSFLAQSLEESRETVQKLAQFGQRQQEELLARQEQIRQAHDHLIQNSHSILEAQEEFRAKQANIFAALDKLYILHNAILAESRFIKAFFFYCCIVFLIYMLTSAKQTFSIRGQLYFALCITLVLEIGLIKVGATTSHAFWVMSRCFLVRMVFMGAATVQILHSISPTVDYEMLTHRLLRRWWTRSGVGGERRREGAAMRRGRERGEPEGYSWVFDELADEVVAQDKMDPSYTLPQREVGEKLHHHVRRGVQSAAAEIGSEMHRGLVVFK